MESGSHKGMALICQQHSLWKPTLHTSAGRGLLCTLQQEVGRYSPHPATTQTIRNHHNPELTLTSSELLFRMTPHNFLLSSMKGTLLLCSLDPPVVLYGLHVPSCNSCAIPK